ncbi:FRG domain-containing protein [Rufibacter tibetensis]|uniref:FRG domain-containing protein n=1 Tax=Rufibacter tibetensis TaxID=512763 RepID=A0A0P0CFS3_9BACT|nr:FRG domain-containing protein [Rufibacter tibetensis]ALJ00758.1 hypothetical protein DC20_19435 [Rufibacter tibetensis]
MQESRSFLETSLNDWKDIFKLSDKLLDDLVFRGQSNKDWKITSSLERLMNRLYSEQTRTPFMHSQEMQMIEEFQWKYSLFKSKNINEDDYVEWLSIMQHYGACTRLVDFSDSLFVATFMAIFESSTDSAVWALNKYVVNYNTYTEFRREKQKTSASAQELDAFSLELANKYIKEVGNTINKLVLVHPKNINERLYRQQGLFIMPTNIQNSFMDNLSDYLGNNDPNIVDIQDLIAGANSFVRGQLSLLKINIPKEIQLSVLKHLREMNINSEILFPGIEGLAKSLNYSKQSYQDYLDMIRRANGMS